MRYLRSLLFLMIAIVILGGCQRKFYVNVGLLEAKGYSIEGHRIGEDLDNDGIPNDMVWLGSEPLKVYNDPSFSLIHTRALARAIRDIDESCACRVLSGPFIGEPIYKQAVSGAPDQGTIFVRDDGKFEPTKAHADPYSFPDGRIYSAEVIVPQEGLANDGIFSRALSEKEIYQTILHELGHAIGLAHSQDRQSFMYSHQILGDQVITSVDRKLLYRVYGGRI